MGCLRWCFILPAVRPWHLRCAHRTKISTARCVRLPCSSNGCALKVRIQPSYTFLRRRSTVPNRWGRSRNPHQPSHIRRTAFTSIARNCWSRNTHVTMAFPPPSFGCSPCTALGCVSNCCGTLRSDCTRIPLCLSSAEPATKCAIGYLSTMRSTCLRVPPAGPRDPCRSSMVVLELRQLSRKRSVC